MIEKYQRYIEELGSKRKSEEKEEPYILVNLSKRNSFLRDRYLQFKKENELLKDRISSLTKSDVKEFKLTT